MDISLGVYYSVIFGKEKLLVKTERKPKANNEIIYGKMAGISHYLSTITLNTNGLNSSIKRYKLENGLKNKSHYLLPTNNKRNQQRHKASKWKERNW